MIGLDILNQKVKIAFPDRSFDIVNVKDIKKVISQGKPNKAQATTTT